MSRKWKPADGGAELSRYTNKTSCSYDPDFDRDVRIRHPEWFVDTAEEKKRELLAMSVGCVRPSCRTFLGLALHYYIREMSSSYDPVFDRAIKERQPGWFVDTVEENKKKLLAMSIGCKRPHAKTSIGVALCTYIYKGSDSYDPEFEEDIRKHQPGWWSADEKKKQLLALPIECDRPIKGKHSLGVAIGTYTNKSSGSYDSSFDVAIKKRQPSWFVSQTEKAAEKKKQLLTMSIGCDRPNLRKHPLGSALVSYTGKTHGSYDPVFNRAIRKSQPGWFVDSAAEKKKQLLTMSIGCDRPNLRKHPLGSALVSYTCKKHGSYDPVFDRTIRARQPQWFKR